jgi:ATP-dependent helicase/nuclease subunit B
LTSIQATKMTAPGNLSITFGLNLDGYEARAAVPALGEVTCGPIGLTQILETQLGLKAKISTAPQRTVQYMRLIESFGEPAFFNKSFEKDPIAVAETLLGWRDNLIEAGWNGQATTADSLRLQALAMIEARAIGHLAPGIADRLRSILCELASRSPHVGPLIVMEDRAYLPTLWQKVCDRLNAQYDVGKSILSDNQAVDGTDLAKVRSALTSPHSDERAKVIIDGDQSIIFLTAFSELVLARAIAQMITRTRQKGFTQSVIAGPNAIALEQALLAADEPALGLDPSSLARPIPQILALALRLYWKPVDPQALLEFLAHPVCPVPGLLRNALAEAVVESPGMGGSKWDLAIQKAKAKAERRHQDDAEARRKALEQHEAALKEWLLVPRFDPIAGAEGPVLATACARVAAWAARRASVPDLEPVESSQYKSLSALASEMAGLLKPRAKVPRTYLERLQQQVCSAGWPGGTTVGELGHVHRVANPGAILDPADVVIWWDFEEPSTPVRLPWTRTELEQLLTHGVQFVPPEAAAARERASWLHPILAARRQIIFVTPRVKGGEAVSAHPLQARLLALCAKGTPLPAIDMDRALSTGTSRDLFDFQQVKHRPLQPLRRWWKLPSGDLLKPRDEESYTSLEKFIYSPYAWVLSHKAQLQPGRVTKYKVEDGSRLNGILLHRLLDLLLAVPAEQLNWRTCNRAELEAWLPTRWYSLLEQEGALLLLPGKRANATALLETGKAALWQLLEQLRAAHITEAASNQQLQAVRFEGGNVSGILDLSVKNQQGEWAVVDLKYGGQPVREKELSENRPLQLAVYGYLWTGNHPGPWPATAFYILNKRSLMAQDNAFFPGASIVPVKGGPTGLQGCWHDFLDVWRWRRRQLDEGWVELTVQGTDALPVVEKAPDSTPPHDQWKAAKDQDQYNDFDALTGWEVNA